MNYLKILCMFFLCINTALFSMLPKFKHCYSAGKFAWAHKKKITATIGFATYYKDSKNKNKSLPIPVKLAFSTFLGPLLVLKDAYFDQVIQDIFNKNSSALREAFDYDLFTQKSKEDSAKTYDSLESCSYELDFSPYNDFKKIGIEQKIKQAIREALVAGDAKRLNRLLGSGIEEKSLVHALYSLENEKKNIGFCLKNKDIVKPYFLHNGQRECIDCAEYQSDNQDFLHYACDTLAELQNQDLQFPDQVSAPSWPQHPPSP